MQEVRGGNWGDLFEIPVTNEDDSEKDLSAVDVLEIRFNHSSYGQRHRTANLKGGTTNVLQYTSVAGDFGKNERGIWEFSAYWKGEDEEKEQKPSYFRVI